MKPSYHPNWIKDDNITSSKKEVITQLWHSNGKCPKGTIPIIRTNKENVLNYAKKRRFPFAYSINSELNSVNQNHEYAIASTQGLFYGAKATFNIWNPKVQVKDEFSLTQLWITGGPYSDLNTIEAGWQVYPGKYGDTTTRLFIFWTSDGYKKNRCYNLDCSGFVQTNNEIAIGGSLSPTSQVDGSQYDITILISWKESKEGNWWMQLGDGKDGKVLNGVHEENRIKNGQFLHILHNLQVLHPRAPWWHSRADQIGTPVCPGGTPVQTKLALPCALDALPCQLKIFSGINLHLPTCMSSHKAKVHGQVHCRAPDRAHLRNQLKSRANPLLHFIGWYWVLESDFGRFSGHSKLLVRRLTSSGSHPNHLTSSNPSHSRFMV